MGLVYENRVIYVEDCGPRALKSSDFNQDLVDLVVKAFNEIDYQGFAPFPPGREDVFGKIDKTDCLGIYLEDSAKDVYSLFYKSFLFHVWEVGEQLKTGEVKLVLEECGSVKIEHVALKNFIMAEKAKLN